MCYSGLCPYEDYMGDCYSSLCQRNGGCPIEFEDPDNMPEFYYEQRHLTNNFACKNISIAVLYMTAIIHNMDYKNNYNKIYIPDLGIKPNEIKNK